jgi:hypothetical protein
MVISNKSRDIITSETIRLRLVRGITIPLGKRIAIPGNRKWWNRMVILILLFGNNSHILIKIQRKLLKIPYIYIKKIKFRKKKKKKNKKKKI